MVFLKALSSRYVGAKELLKASKQETLFKTNSIEREDYPLNRRKKFGIFVLINDFVIEGLDLT